MKSTKITYWITTSIISLMMIFSAFSYFTNPAVKDGFAHLGFPDYFRIELGLAKIIAAIVLLAPLATRIKEWAYAGLTFTFISAFIAHLCSGDPAANMIGPVVFLVIMAVSYITFHKLYKNQSKSE